MFQERKKKRTKHHPWTLHDHNKRNLRRFNPLRASRLHPHSPPRPEGRTKSNHPEGFAAIDEDTPSNSPGFFLAKCFRWIQPLVVSGDMTGILRGRIYSYIPVLVAFDETWYTPSSDTVLLDFNFCPTLNNKRDSKFSMPKKTMQIANLRSSPWWDCSVNSFATSDADPSNQQKRLRCLGWGLPAAKIPGNAWCFARVAVLFCEVYGR